MKIEVVRALPRGHERVEVELAEGASALDAVRASGLGEEHAALAIYGRKVGPAARLQDGDRVELLRPLRHDPREARRRRARRPKPRR